MHIAAVSKDKVSLLDPDDNHEWEGRAVSYQPFLITGHLIESDRQEQQLSDNDYLV